MDLVGTKEVCEMLDVNPANFWYVRERPGFPRPLTSLACGTIWRRVDIERYARREAKTHEHQTATA